MLPEAILFTLHGLLGAFIAVLMRAYSWRYLKTWSAIKYCLLGAIAGYIYWWLHSDYNFPNAVMTIVVGYFAKTFLEDLFQRLYSLVKPRRS